MKRVILSNTVETREILDLVKQGYQLGCPRCNSDLTVSFYIDPKTKERLPHTINCPKNTNHFGLILDYNLTDFWKEFDEEMNMISEQAKK